MRNVVPLERLEAVAAMAKPKPKPESRQRTEHTSNGNGEFRHRLKVDEYLRDNGIGFTEKVDGGTVKYLLDECLFNPEHKKPDSGIFQYDSGKLIYHCSHDSCQGKRWHDAKAVLGNPRPEHWNPPKPDYAERHRDREQSQQAERTTEKPEPIKPVRIGDLIRRNPKLRETVVDGIVRRGETCNIIANPKVGKSWMSYGLALSIVVGAKWLDKFRCRRGRVLIIDNELHDETEAHRVPVVAEAMGLQLEDYEDGIEVVTLRGRLLNLEAIGHRIVDHLEAGTFDAIIVDAWYRVLGDDENSNGAMARAYNLVDRYAIQTGAAWFLIHHASKGSQAEKRTTDVGAGAGAQSRAADSHLILREHEDDGIAVLDAAVRSFPPIEPVPLQWTFPVWKPADGVDPEKLKGRKSDAEKRQSERDREGKDQILDAISTGPKTRRQMRTVLGMGPDRLNRLVRQLTQDGEAEIIENDEQELVQKVHRSGGLDW